MLTREQAGNTDMELREGDFSLNLSLSFCLSLSRSLSLRFTRAGAYH